MRDFFNKPVIKAIVIGVLALIISGICSSMGTWDKNVDKAFAPKLLCLVVFSLLYLVALVFYSATEVSEKKETRLFRNQNDIYARLLAGIMTECKYSANGANKVIHSIIEKSNANLQLWNFEDECTRLVDHILTILQKIGDGNDFEVLYDRLIEDDATEEYVVTVAYANKKKIKPSIYKIKRKIRENDKDTQVFHDIDLFNKKSADIEILVDSDEIDAAFGYETKEQRNKNKKKYSQYIAIPVFCNENKMIGLIEIVCLNNTKLANDKEEIDDIISRFIIPYSYLTLVFHKMERALVAKPLKGGTYEQN